MVTSRIVATGAGIPSQVITNDDLAQIMDTSDEWIRQRTGIGERHISGGEDLSYYTTKAARQIIERAGIAPEDIDLIVVATVTADYCTPSAACMVQKEIGAVNAVAFDVTAACSGFLYGVSVADKFIRCGVYKNALVIGGEILSKIVDWQDRSTCVLFGDGAAGVLLQFPFYAGIMGMMVAANDQGVSLAGVISQFFVSVSNNVTFPMLSFLAAGVVNFFVPSGGGQWAVQGPIMMPAGAAMGIENGRTAMAIAWGDQWTNMIQPFWALPALGIAKLSARDIMGYLVIVTLFMGVVACLGFLAWAAWF